MQLDIILAILTLSTSLFLLLFGQCVGLTMLLGQRIYIYYVESPDGVITADIDVVAMVKEESAGTSLLHCSEIC